MRQIVIPVRPSATDDAVQRAVVAVCNELGLTVASRTTLATYPGSVHWHVRQPPQPGTMEITWWVSEHRLWLSVHANRGGEWVEEAMARVKERVSQLV